MSTIVTRAGKGSPLTNTELDSNFTNLNTDKAELSGATFTGNLSLGDGVSANFGASNDLQIYHDGSNSYIAESNATGNLFIKGTHISLQNSAGQDALNLINGDAYIKSGGQTKLQTTSSGISVTGSVTADGLKVGATDRIYLDGGSNTYIQESASDDLRFFVGGQQAVRVRTFGTDILGTVTADGLTVANTGFARITLQDSDATNQKGYIDSSGGDLNLTSQNGTSHGDIFLKRYNGTSTVLSAQFASNGDISFYNDSANQGLFWDSSTSRLGLGTTVPALAGGDIGLHINATNYPEIKITNSTTGSGAADGTVIQGNGNNLNIHNREAGSISLATSNVERLNINSSGNATFSGSVTANAGVTVGGNVDFGDRDMARFGVGNDLQIFHNGTDNYIKNATSDQDLIIQGNDGGNIINALTLDMSAAGAATFNSSVTTGSTVNAYGNGSVALQWGDTSALGSLSFDTSANPVIRSASSKPLVFQTNGANERMRIDSSGNLLVGSSSTPSGSTDGTVIFASGTIASYRTGAAPAVFSRNASNGGEVVVIQQQGTTVGSIGTTGGKLEIDGPSNNSGLRFHESSLIPRKNGDVTNGQVDLGYNDGSIILGFRNLTLSNAIKASTLKFENSAGTTEYARFDSSNNLLVGTTGANTYSSTVNTGVQIAPDFIGVARNQNTVMHLNRQGNDGTIVDFRTFGFVRGSVSISGSTTSYNTSSDERLKDNIIDAPIASEDIDAIQVRSFDWKADGEHQKYGMVAQELLEVAPDAVTQGDTPDDMMGVDYSKLVPMLIKEIQSLRQRVAQLEE